MNAFFLMEDVSDKLHILDYEVKFCKQMKNGLKPIPRTYLTPRCITEKRVRRGRRQESRGKRRRDRLLNDKRYFALPASNPNEQFYYFTMLIAWLMRLCGHHFSPPGQFDDPNATSATLGTILSFFF